MKICTKCNQSKEESEFSTYWHSSHQKYYTRGYCKDCVANQKKEYRGHKKAMKNIDFDSVGEDYLKYPNQYINENQRLATFHIMEMLGWTFNKKNNIWFKEPHKLRDGTFPNLKKFDRPHNRSIKTETINQIREFFKEGHKVHQIAKMCNVHPSTAYRYCHSDLNYKKNKYIPKKKRNDSIE